MHLLQGGYAAHGEVFTVPVLTQRVTFLVGPVVSPHFFKASDEEMSQKEVRGMGATWEVAGAFCCVALASRLHGDVSTAAHCPGAACCCILAWHIKIPASITCSTED